MHKLSIYFDIKRYLHKKLYNSCFLVGCFKQTTTICTRIKNRLAASHYVVQSSFKITLMYIFEEAVMSSTY